MMTGPLLAACRERELAQGRLDVLASLGVELVDARLKSGDRAARPRLIPAA